MRNQGLPARAEGFCLWNIKSREPYQFVFENIQFFSSILAVKLNYLETCTLHSLTISFILPRMK